MGGECTNMAGLQCACGSEFFATCDIEPTSCAFAWLLLLVSAIAHAVRCCAADECESESDEDEGASRMYT